MPELVQERITHPSDGDDGIVTTEDPVTGISTFVAVQRSGSNSSAPVDRPEGDDATMTSPRSQSRP
jgi:hypothetical protein